MSAFSQFFLGSPSQAQQLPNVTDEQKQLLDQILGRVQSPLSSGFQNLQNILGGSPEAFSAFERPAMRQFQEEIIPSITERFAGLGAGSSSGLQQTLARSGERLSENLAAQRSGLQGQALSQLMGLLGTGLSPQFQYLKKEGSEGVLPSILSLLGAYATGGSQLGGITGSGISGLFRKKPRESITDAFTPGRTAAGPYSDGSTYNPYTGVMA